METTYSVIAYNAKSLPDQYKGLIFAKWLRSLRFGNDWFKKIDSKGYYEAYHGIIENILSQSGTLVRLAVLTDDHDVVLGFSVSRDHTLDYVYVQKDIRRSGIGKKLVPKDIDVCTHLTKTGDIILKKYPKLKFNPFV